MNANVEAIWDALAGRLVGFIRSRVRDPEAAQDILQNVFVRIHQKLPTLRTTERLEAWVWRIVRNAIADHFRRNRTLEPLNGSEESAVESEPEVPDLRGCVRQFVQRLETPYREALLLTEWEGLSQEEMGLRLGLSASGARTRMQRARRKLKKLLTDCCNFELDRRGNVIEMLPRKDKCAACR